jgi:hypothetical protein
MQHHPQVFERQRGVFIGRSRRHLPQRKENMPLRAFPRWPINAL